MLKFSVIARQPREMLIAMLSIAVVVLAGCGGGSSAASTPPPVANDPPAAPPAPATINGVATPTSVAVVTATNVQ